MEEKKNPFALRKAKKKRTRIVIAVIVLLVIAAAVAAFFLRPKTNAGLQASLQTDTVTKRSLTKSVGATGTVASMQTKDVSVSLSGVEVTDVLVKVGDTVKAGDTLVTLDSTDIQKSLDTAKENLGIAQKQQQISNDTASRSVSDAQRTQNYQVDNASTAVTTTHDAYVAASDDYNKALDKLNSLKETESKAKSASSDAKSAYTSAQDATTAAKSALDTAQADYNAYVATAGYDQSAADQKKATADAAQNAYTTAQANEASALSAYQTAKTAYETAKSARETYQDTADKLYDALQTASANYTATQKSYDNTVATQNSSVASAKSSQATTALSDTASAKQTEVDKYQEQLDDCTVKAPFSGVVTAVNVESGSTYTGGTILTIQDCSAYELEADISQYDISDMKLGQKVLIKTDATGDTELTGAVSFISPVPESSASSASSASSVSSYTSSSSSASSSDASYQVKISLDQQNERLRLGMSASISIIIEQHDNVLTVPYNAVSTDENGDSYVEVVDNSGIQPSSGKDNGAVGGTETTTKTVSGKLSRNQQSQDSGAATTKVPVTVVLESNYYTEIQSDKIKEGMTVVVNQTTTDSGNMQRMFRQGGGF